MTKNLTTGSPLRLIVAFTLPLLVGNIFQQFYQFTDAAVVGRFIGVDALAAVGATGSLTFLLIGFTWGSSAGLAIPVAEAFGAGDMRQMRRSVVAGVYLSIGIAVAITFLGCFGSRAMLLLLQTPPELLEDATGFLLVTFLGSTATVAFNFLSSVIRALGDSRTPLIFLIIACVLNAGLVALFIGVFHLGVPGAALATVVAQFVSVLLCLALIAVKMPYLHIPRSEWRLQASELKEPAKLGLTMGFQTSIIAIGSLVLQYAVNGLGATALAAYTAAMRVDQVAVAPLNSFSVAMSTYAAQNRGALQWKRIRVGVFRVVALVSGLALALGAVNILFGTYLVRIFVGPGEDEMVAMAHQYLIVEGAMYIFLAVMFVLRGTIQGMGWTAVPTLAGIMELLLRAAAGIFLVGPIGFLGVCWASPLAWVGAIIPLVIAWFVLRKQLLKREHPVQMREVRVEPELAACGSCPA
ncbi:MAG: MATE family efflux transporter [Propionibacteriaceae bacterium]|jgi:putative MATE family efflux protein|nr:MATE family efflux transporter [Propionibacteriaceae bacterium]